MSRGIDLRLRKLEAARSPRVRMVWSNTSDAAEWDRKIAEMLAAGEASPNDEFMRIGWLTLHSRPASGSCIYLAQSRSL